MKFRKALTAFIAFILVSVGLLSGCIPPPPENPDALYVAVVNKGYGMKFVTELMKAYEKKTGVEMILDWHVPLEERVRTTMLAGPKTNKVDVYFNINDYLVNGLLAMGEAIKGYDRLLLDLTDMYDMKPEGFDGLTVSELMYPYYMDASTFYNGKKYFITWATGYYGMVYNVKLFEKYNLSIPRTTDEMFELMDDMKEVNNGSYATNSEGKTVYPFVYPGKNNYCEGIALTWRAQYQGAEAFYNALQGKDPEGEYSYEIFEDYSILRAYEIIERIVKIGTNDATSNGYVSPKCISDYIFTEAQLHFLNGEAFMMPNGDWLEREAEANFTPGSVDIAFMRLPIISAIVEVLPKKSITDDQTLRDVVGLIDDELAGNQVTIPDGVDQEDYDFLKQARMIAWCQSANHQIFIPSYSNNIEKAKDFILFTMSKEGQEIVLKNSYGNTYPFDVDFSSFTNFSNLTNFQKSKFQLMKEGVIWIGMSANHPMAYSGGLRPNYYIPEQRMGVRTNATGTYMTAEELFIDQYKYYKENWNHIMRTSGVSN